MAKLAEQSLVIEKPANLPWEDYRKWMEGEFRKLENVVTDPDAADLTGAFLQFPVADSYAYYRVIQHKPLVIQHVAICDGWHIPMAHIRGIQQACVREQLEHRAFMKKLWEKRDQVA